MHCTHACKESTYIFELAVVSAELPTVRCPAGVCELRTPKQVGAALPLLTGPILCQTSHLSTYIQACQLYKLYNITVFLAEQALLGSLFLSPIELKAQTSVTHESHE